MFESFVLGNLIYEFSLLFIIINLKLNITLILNSIQKLHYVIIIFINILFHVQSKTTLSRYKMLSSLLSSLSE